MSQTLLFYRRAGAAAVETAALYEQLSVLGVEWSCGAGESYIPGNWYCPRTRARAIIDLGESPLEQDLEHPSNRYDGWEAAGLTMNIPLVGPHWAAVEAYRLVETLLAADDELAVLDTEDTCKDSASDSGPFPWDRARAVWSWEKLRLAQVTGLTLPCLGRAASLALWRWRRERGNGAEWPGLAVVEDRRRPGTALLVAVIGDLDATVFLPPVDGLLLRAAPGGNRDPGLRLIAGERLAGLTGTPGPAGCHRVHGLATWWDASDRIDSDRLRPLDDEEWRD